MTFALVFILLFIHTFRYITKTNRDLNIFLETIQSPDYILNDKTSDLSYHQLNKTYHKITEQIKNSWIEKEKQQQYFRYTLEHIPIGVIAFDKEGKLEFYNSWAKTILNFNHLDNIRQLGRIGEELLKIKSKEPRLIPLASHLENLKLLAQAVQIKLDQKQIHIVTLQNIKTQLEESEIEAWQKLIRVLTHEIMNSVTPIKSLTYSLLGRLNASENPDSGKDSLLKGLTAIEKRSRGLLNFVESYKNLTQIPKPVYQRIVIHQLFDSVTELLDSDLNKNRIRIQKKIVPHDLTIVADEKLVVQVVINLIRNAMIALASIEEKTIELLADKIDDTRTRVQVKDHGHGIPEEVVDKIFIPFFSTTEGGSGIGLSFARQVMILHHGRIEVQSSPGDGTTFSLYFQDKE
ncbi:MAG: ATP-binding protein [Bacteroidales bacterium]|nr:ATP-binding protein [Bacteroidales bacterium]